MKAKENFFRLPFWASLCGQFSNRFTGSLAISYNQYSASRFCR